MGKKRDNYKESFLVKIYIVLFFILGIALWYSIDNTKNPPALPEVGGAIERQIDDILFESGVKQSDIILQYARQTKDDSAQWLEYHKTIILKSASQLKQVDDRLKQAAQASNLELEKQVKPSTTIYRFYSPNKRTHSILTFLIQPQKPATQQRKQ